MGNLIMIMLFVFLLLIFIIVMGNILDNKLDKILKGQKEINNKLNNLKK
jgi:type IV secretory pathway VirB6-like protein